MYHRLADKKNYIKFYFQDSFWLQCMDINTMTMEHFDRTMESIRSIISNPIFRNVKHIIGSGCGDSNIAAFCVKQAFEHYLPDVEYESVEAVELSRHYEFEEDCSDTIAIFISYSGMVNRSLEAMEVCKKHGITTIGMTDNKESQTAKNCDIYFYTNIPKGDNNAGNRTYCANMISATALAAAIAEVQQGKEYIPELRAAVQKMHDDFFGEIANIDEVCFRTAIDFLDKKIIEVVGDGPMFWAAKFIQAKVMELSGDPCPVIDSENFWHVNAFLCPDDEICDLVLINGNDTNVARITEDVHDMVKAGRDVFVFSNLSLEELGITEDVHYCHMPLPEKEWNFLAPIYGYLPGAIFAGFRHTTIGEPMFRGGFDRVLFAQAYRSPAEDINR